MKSYALPILAASVALLATGCASQSEPVVQAPVEVETPALVSDVLDAAAQQALTPQQVLDNLKAGNRRFVEGTLTGRDFMAQAEATAAAGQFPQATFLGCLDSRVPPEIIFDQGIGDAFVGRVAGNVEDVNLVGSFEFATAVTGTKVLVVLGHTECGAIKGAADGVELGNLTELLENFEGPLERAAAATEGEATSDNAEFINLAVEENVRQTVADILEQSDIIAEPGRETVT